MNIRYSTNLIKYTPIVMIAMLMMHPLHSIMGIGVKTFFCLTFVCLFIQGFPKVDGLINISLAWPPFVLFMFGLIGSTISGSFHQLLISVTGSGMILAIGVLHQNFSAKSILKILLFIDVLLLTLSILAFIYAYCGGTPTGWALNQEAKKLLPLYLTAFSNSVEGNLIRPSGFFDEPGTLAMFNILVICFNEIVGRAKKVSLCLLFMGLITYSPISLIGLILFILINRFWMIREIKKYPLIPLVAFITTCLFVISLRSHIDIFLLNRLNIENGWFSGDNRSRQVILFFNILTPAIFFQGARSQNIIIDGDLSSNPFSILFESGIFVWIPYAVIELFLLRLSLERNKEIKFSAIIIMLLLLVRPNIYSLYNGLFIWMVILLLSNKYKNNILLGHRML